MICDHIQALALWRDLVKAITADSDPAIEVKEIDLRNDALTTRPVGPENAMALLTMCGEHVSRCGQALSEDDFEVVCNASDTALEVMHGLPK